MHPFCILMLIFAGAILLYAGLLALTKDYGPHTAWLCNESEGQESLHNGIR